MPEALPKNHGSSYEPGLWFQNRGLFSDHFLKARLPEWKEWKIDEELSTFRKSLLSLYESKKTILPNFNEAQTENEFIQPVLDLLGYANSYIVQAPTKIGQQTNRSDYALFPDESTKNKAYQKLKGNDYAQCIGIADAKYWERELDLAKSSDRDTFTNQNPSFQIVSYLTSTQQRWGILTNGRLWRLYYIKSHLPLGNYYQVDLVKLLEEAPEEKLKYFYLFFRKAALLQVDGKSFLDYVFEGSNEYAAELEADIKERAYKVVEFLCRGFATGFSPRQLDAPTLKDIYDNSLTLLYRLLFVFYAEARELLPLTSSVSYRDNYSMHKITHDIDEVIRKGQPLSSQSTIYYQRIGNLFGLINTGDPGLGIPEYNGGLFNLEEHPFLEEYAIADAFLVPAIQQLAQVYDKELKRVVAVDYNTLSERHLGSIYEGLLEFKPRIAPHDLVTVKEKSSIKYAPADKHPDKKIAYKKNELYLANDKGERKASGSYYTPEYIVNYIVENTLDPLVKEAQDKLKALKPEVDKATAKWQKLKEQKQGLEPTDKYDRKIAEEHERLLEPYLSLKVLDPAMGSGHFLARATDFLAEAIATDPSIESPLELTEESELTYYRRRVVENCIYGVDLNPLAVELAKLTLWLGTMAKSKPLSFLNHHLRVGNSLIGAEVAELGDLPLPKTRRKKVKIADLSRRPAQSGLFDEAFNKKLYDLLQNRALIARFPTETLEDIHNKEKWERDFEHNAERFRTLADLWVSTYFGNQGDEYYALLDNLQSPQPEWEKLLQKETVKKALAMRDERHFFHWELEFPEVFYDEQGNRKTNPGFDAVVGNPPMISSDNIAENEKGFFENQWTKTARHRFDISFLFWELGFQILRSQGRFSLLFPSHLLSGEYFTPTRHFMVNEWRIHEILDFGERFFREVANPICLVRATKGVFEPVPAILVAEIEDEARLEESQRHKLPIDIVCDDYIVNSSGEQSKVARFFVSPHVIALKGRTKGHPMLNDVAVVCDGIQTANLLNELFIQMPENQEHYSRALRRGESIPCRYGLAEWEGWWVLKPEFTRHLKRPGFNYDSPRRMQCFSSDRKIILRQTEPTIVATIDDAKFLFPNSIFQITATHKQLSLDFLLSLLNSKFMRSFYEMLARVSGTTKPQVYLNLLKAMPIRRINFTTPEKERRQLLEQGKELYQECLQSQDWDKILAFVAERLPQKADGTPDVEHEQSDVVHDLLAFLAEEMTRLNKDKQSKIKGFLTWLEKEILEGSVEDQKNKTKIKGFHENSFEDLLDVLKKNKSVPDPCPSQTRDTIASEFSATMGVLTPLKARIKATDNLIDQIVYRLYGLTDDEIAIVKGKGI